MKDELSQIRKETSEQTSFLETKLNKSSEDYGSNLEDLINKSETFKSAIDDVINKLEVQTLISTKTDSRLAENEKWISELKTNLNSLISESDLLKLNLKQYQVRTIPNYR